MAKIMGSMSVGRWHWWSDFSISHWYFPHQYVTYETLYFKPSLRSKRENKAMQLRRIVHYNGRMVPMYGDKSYQHRNHPTIYGVMSNSSLLKKNKRCKIIKTKQEQEWANLVVVRIEDKTCLVRDSVPPSEVSGLSKRSKLCMESIFWNSVRNPIGPMNYWTKKS